MHNAQDMIDAIRHAYALARINRAEMFIIEQNGQLRATQHPSPSDRIVVGGVTPPRWNAEIEHAVATAYREFRDAEPALRRAAHIVKTSHAGPRPAPDIEEIAEEIMRRFCISQDLAAGSPQHRTPQRKPGFFSRMWGSAR